MAELYVGNLDPNTTTRKLEQELQVYGEILSIKLPHSSIHRYASVQFKHLRDAQFAIHSWKNKFNWRLELSKNCAMRLVASGGASVVTRGDFDRLLRDCSFGVVKDMENKGVKQPQRGGTEKNQVASTSTWKPVPPPPPPWVELPEDLTAKILHKLGPVVLLMRAQKVCSTWRKICRDPAMWRVIDMWKLGDVVGKYNLPYNGKDVLCRRAVVLSQGQVTEINIEDFGSGILLGLIAERCGNLRCLRLVSCEEVSGKTLSRLAKGFPLLEALHLICTPVQKPDIEAIGQSCPMLKTFALNGNAYDSGMGSSEEAIAVATFMPELRHLELFGNRMTNDALEAILNGCPKLESLDLRKCANLNLEGELGKRCAQQIKILRRPHDPIDDYEWYNKIPHWVQEYSVDCDFDDFDYDDFEYDDFDYDDYTDPYQFDGGFGDFII